MTAGLLNDRRVLVVGASAGIGRAFAVAATRGGAQVVLTARRTAALDAAVEEAGGGTAVAGDVADDASRRAVVDAAVGALGQIDLVFCTVGVATLSYAKDADARAWEDTFRTNVVGLNQLIRDLLPHLAPGAIVAALSSETVAQPRVGLAAYAASKAALEASIAAWRSEHPEVRFSCIAVGATQPTDFGAQFDLELLGPMLDDWVRHGLLQERFMDTTEVARYLTVVLGAALELPEIGVERLLLRSSSPVMGTTGANPLLPS
jgi:NAD(P)-dependent dehydrogenase (short-subunit alcohol dehydrogenase family)